MLDDFNYKVLEFEREMTLGEILEDAELRMEESPHDTSCVRFRKPSLPSWDSTLTIR